MIELLTSGFQTSIQDMGRCGFRKYGVPVSGVMDQKAALVANQIIGNKINDALIEINQNGPILKFLSSTWIAISGASFTPSLDGIKIQMNRAYHINPGQILKFGHCADGNYGYLAVKGGILTDKKLGSRSFYKSITETERIKKGALLPISPFSVADFSANVNAKVVAPSSSRLIDTYRGPEFFMLSETQQKYLIQTQLELSSEVSRMGFRLKNQFDTKIKEIITAPVQPGTVQFTPSGQLIILMRDAQITGGYARILQITPEGINQLSQKRQTNTFKFRLIEP